MNSSATAWRPITSGCMTQKPRTKEKGWWHQFHSAAPPEFPRKSIRELLHYLLASLPLLPFPLVYCTLFHKLLFLLKVVKVGKSKAQATANLRTVFSIRGKLYFSPFLPPHYYCSRAIWGSLKMPAQEALQLYSR